MYVLLTIIEFLGLLTFLTILVLKMNFLEGVQIYNLDETFANIVISSQFVSVTKKSDHQRCDFRGGLLYMIVI
jgi:hypothetical protein